MFFLLYKFIMNMIFSPMIFILFFILIAFFIKKDKRKYVKYTLIFSCVFIYVFSTPFLKDFLLISLENTYKVVNENDLKNADFYIVLGGGIYDNAPLSLSSENGIPSEMALARLYEVLRLYNYDKKKIFLTGGKVYNTAIYSEAEVYKKFLMSAGVDSDDIFIEDKSKTTYENAKNIKKMLDEKKLKKPILISSAFHLKRTVYTFNKLGIENIPAPCDYKTSRGKYNLMALIPDFNNLVLLKIVFWEYTGIIYYKLKKM